MLTRKARSTPTGPSPSKKAKVGRQVSVNTKKVKAVKQVSDKNETENKPPAKMVISSNTSSERTGSPYDFICETVSTDTPVSGIKQKKGRKDKSKNANIKCVGQSKTAPKLNNKMAKKSKTGVKSVKPNQLGGGKKVLCAVQRTVVTPVLRKRPTREHLKIPQPNLDDVSPIMGSSKPKKCEKKSSPGQKRRRECSIEGGRQLRSAKKLTPSMLETPPVSFTVPKCDFNDSAIFLEPKANLFKSTKTSTPTINPKGKQKLSTNKIKQDKKKKLGREPVVTSTPNDLKPQLTYTKLKKKTEDMSPLARVDNIQFSTKESKMSPVVRGETPTSDYASMDSEDLVPSPSPLKQTSKKAFVPTPAFSLDDDLDVMSLNKSFDDRSYNSAKRQKKKLVKDKRRESIIEEWADKVNSELEDVENFELSVEG